MNAPAPTEIDHPNFEHLPGDTDKKKSRKTRYEIAVQSEPADDKPALWENVAVVEASSADAAIRDWFNEGVHPFTTPIVLRAVPVRNITQRTVSVKTHTQLSFS
jgi:hypothetical protein